MTTGLAPAGGFGVRVWRSAAWVTVLLGVASFGAVHLAVTGLGLPPAVAAQALYLPVVLFAIRFGTRAGIGAGLAGGVLVWLLGDGSAAALWTAATTLALVGVGVLVGSSVRALTVAHHHDLTAWWDSELTGHGAETSGPNLLTDAQVRQAIETGAFYPLFQPIYALDDGRLVATEALTRFDSHPPVPPSHWFAHAARLGLGTTLELMAIDKSLASVDGLPPDVVLSVNASAATLLDPRLEELLRRSRRTVMLELTELEPVADYHRLFAALGRLRAVGARIAIVNVGASLTSLRHIGRLAPEVLKLDGTLVTEGREDPVRWALTKRLLRHARATGTYLVVEGVEDAVELHTWRALGAQAAQGYLLGRPGPLTFPYVFTFPEPRAERRRSRRRTAVHHPRDPLLVADGLTPSQLGEGTFFGRDLTP